MTHSQMAHRPCFENTALQQGSQHDTNTAEQHEQVPSLKMMIHLQVTWIKAYFKGDPGKYNIPKAKTPKVIL